MTVFFVLSGFVLGFNYFDDFRHPTFAGTYNFFLARFARVYPLYLAVLGYVLLRQYTTGGDVSHWPEHLLALQAWSSGIDVAYAYNGPAWSIGVEFFLYACFPLLIPVIAALDRRRALLISGGIVILGMIALVVWFTAVGRGGLPWDDPGSAHRWLYRTPLTRLGDFVLGILAARLFVSGLRVGNWVAPMAAAVLMGLMAWPALRFTPWSWDVAFAVPAVLLIFALATAPTSWLSRGLSLSPVVILGEASYAFYLVHQPAIGYLGAGRWAAEPLSASLVVLEAFNLAVVAALAIGLHFSLELPARRWLRRRQLSSA